MAKLNFPADLKYSRSDEWVRVQGDEATIGISDYAQNELGDVVYIELPWDEAGKREVTAEDHFGDIESVKATSPLFSPVAGTIVRLNEALKERPEIVNSDPYGEGWMIVVKLSGSADLSGLMDAAGYQTYNESREH
jgi:glycine cleavage system H protein